MANPTLNDWKQMYRALWRIRLFEGQVQRLAAAGEVPGFPHLSTGQEAVAVGVCAHLGPEDVLYTSHRGHGHVLAKGSDLEATLAEIMGRDTGLCRGRGGSMHLVDAANGVLGATGVVAGNLALAAGAAWAAQAQNLSTISVAFFGDGATGAGVFHETLNLATLWKLPLLFVCENNGYAEFTSREEHSNVNHVSAFAAPYGIPTQTIDGNDLLAVHAQAAFLADAHSAQRRARLAARLRGSVSTVRPRRRAGSFFRIRASSWLRCFMSPLKRTRARPTTSAWPPRGRRP